MTEKWVKPVWEPWKKQADEVVDAVRKECQKQRDREESEMIANRRRREKEEQRQREDDIEKLKWEQKAIEQAKKHLEEQEAAQMKLIIDMLSHNRQ